MGLDRRTFLQQAALALISIGASEAGINLLSQNPRLKRWLQPYVATLAQTTNRKLALLVGINEYSQKSRLHGCVNDVELQKELLVHRFGFKPQDVHILTNRQATRENIETAFVEYLKEDSQSDDIILFHFSGYGNKVKLPSSVTEAISAQSLVKLKPESETNSNRLINSLVPVDSSIPNKGKPAANDLLQDTLISLGRALKTNNLIMVLDASFQQTKEPLQGNFRIRSYNSIAPRPNPEELAFQGQIQRNMASKTLAFGKNLAIPGIFLSGAEQNQIALEGTWNNFSAGLLTYALTQYLWQTMPQTNIIIPLQQAANIVSSWSEKQQQPKLVGKTKPNFTRSMDRDRAVGGEGFIEDLDSKGMVDLQMTGLPLPLLDGYEAQSCFRIPRLADNSPQSLLQLRSREGITAKAQWLGASNLERDFVVGKLIQEAIRVIPRNLGLSVALDNHLERIERVDATSALANIAEVKTVNTAGEAYADCLLGKISLMVDKKAENTNSSAAKAAYSYGLYTSRGNLIPDTTGEANEVVKIAINRLETYFKKLLAAKLLEFTVNQNSSTIPVVATLELAQKNSPLRRKTSYRILPGDLENGIFSEDVPTLERSSEIQLKIDNQSDRDLYGVVLGVDSEEKLITFYSPQKVTTQKVSNPDNLEITAHTQLTIPQSDNSWRWRVIEPLGIARIYLILSIQPFANTLELVARQPTAKFDEQQIIPLPDSLEIAKAVLQDLHISSAVDPQIIGSSSDLYALNVNSWTSFKFTYDVI